MNAPNPVSHSGSVPIHSRMKITTARTAFDTLPSVLPPERFASCG